MTDDLDFIRELQADPEKYWAAVLRYRETHAPDEARERYNELLAEQARESDGYESYVAYHELIHGTKPLAHEPIREAFEAHAAGEIFLELGFRGSHKTTTFDVTLGSFLIGHHPSGTGVVTGANDSNAKLIAKSIAQIIENHLEFKRVFPHVTIYKERGWGAEGYWVRDSRMTLEAWTAQQAKVNDPTFIGGGYKSSEINGKHPSLFLMVDDLLDIDSAASVAEREYIKNVFMYQILPTVVRENEKLITRVLVTGVPFANDDAYQELRAGGGCVYIELPVMRRAAEGAKGAVYIDGVNEETGAVYEDIQGWWYLAWPENFGVKTILFWRAKGKNVFWQMFMIDIAIAKSAGLRYYLYPHLEIGFDLPTAGGADPTSIDPDHEVGGNKRSSFALSYVCKLLRGGLVVKDGFLKPVGFMGAKNAILHAQSMFTNWIMTGVEGVGVGKAFQQFLRLFSEVLFVDSNIIDPRGVIRDKRTRFEGEVSPWLESGVIKISDEPTPFNLALRYGLDHFFELDFKKPHESIDAMDSLYHAAKRFPEVLREYASNDISPQGLQDRGSLWTPFSLGAKPHGR